MNKWNYTGKETQPDSKHRINLGPNIYTPSGVRYKIMQNQRGQILLDPVKSVPADEAWIYENPKIITSIKRSIAQAEAGQLHSIDLDSGNDEDK